MLMKCSMRLLTLACAAMLLLNPARSLAQGVSADKYFPEGTDTVIQLNLNQLMGSRLLAKGIPLVVKKYGENVMSMMANFVPDDNVKKMMQDMAPELKNHVTEEAVSRAMEAGKEAVRDFTVAINSKEEINGIPQLTICMGIPAVNAAMVEQFVPMMQGSGQIEVKSEEIGGVTVFEMKPNTAPMAFYMAVPEDGMMVMSISKDTLTKTIKNKGKNNVNPEFKALLAQRKNSYTLFAAGLAPKNRPGEKHFVATLTVDKDINGNVNVECEDADKAKEKAKEANEHFEGAVSSIKDFADDHPELKPLSESLKKVKAEVTGSSIKMNLSVNGDDLIKAMKDAK